MRMSETGDIYENGIGEGQAADLRQILRGLKDKLRRYYRLLIVLVVTFGIVAFILAMVVTPVYTAVATIAPPTSSISTSMLTSDNALGSLSKLAGLGGMGGQADPFSVYTELLTSNRLAGVLAADPDFMHTIFYKKYDAETKQWRVPSGPLVAFKNFVKRQIGYPIKTHPDADDLAKFFEENLDVGTSLTSSFVTVSLKFKDPVQAQNLLQTVLITADDLERRDMRADVAARLTYLAKTLDHVTQTEQRDALITILSTQEQARMMIAADKRFAVNLVDPAHANAKPTFPNIIVFGMLAFLLAAACWWLAVYTLPPQHRLLTAFARSGSQEDYLSRPLPE